MNHEHRDHEWQALIDVDLNFHAYLVNVTVNQIGDNVIIRMRVNQLIYWEEKEIGNMVSNQYK